MVRGLFPLFLGLTALYSFGLQTLPKVAGAPSVSITLPRDISSEAVQIRYFLRGPFGGYGGYVKQQIGLHSYEIATSIEGKAATEIRLIAYAPGCAIQTFTLPLDEASGVTQAFECRHLSTVTLSGQIVPSESIRDRAAELILTYMAYWAHEFFGITDGPVVQIELANVFTYMAYWAHEFFGITDGPVVQIELANVSPDADGMFQIVLPDFTAGDMPPSYWQHGSLFLGLRDAKTWNSITSDLQLEPADLMNKDYSLQMRSSYPALKIHISVPPS